MRTPRFWQHRGLFSTLLLPFGALYGLGFFLDSVLTRKHRAPLPVISIGNITAGGAGKTPTAIALAHLLQNLGETPHIVSRGYGGRIAHTHAVDPARDNATDVGDEALLLVRAAPTWIARRRIDAIRAAQHHGATVILADDALQHHSLAHDLSVLVIDLAYGFGNGRLLPAGPLRQSLSSAYGQAETIALLIGEDDPHHLVATFDAPWRATLTPTGPTEGLREGKWLAFAGIAHPQKFYATLRQHGATLARTRDFPDHHSFREEELLALQNQANDEGLRLITTEKDAMRLPTAMRRVVAILPVALAWADAAGVERYLAQWLASHRVPSGT